MLTTRFPGVQANGIFNIAKSSYVCPQCEVRALLHLANGRRRHLNQTNAAFFASSRRAKVAASASTTLPDDQIYATGTPIDPQTIDEDGATTATPKLQRSNNRTLTAREIKMFRRLTIEVDTPASTVSTHPSGSKRVGRIRRVKPGKLKAAQSTSLSEIGIEIDDLHGQRTLEEVLMDDTPNMEAAAEAEDPSSRVKSATSRRSGKERGSIVGDHFSMKTGDLILEALKVERNPIPRLSYGLDRALFNSGVLDLRDPHSRVFNFDPYLEKIMPVHEFDFDTIKDFTPPSRDHKLGELAASLNKKFVASSSSMTGLLKHFHYLISVFRRPDFSMMSRDIPVTDRTTFTKIQFAPEAVILRWKNGFYAMDADKQYDHSNILGLMGIYMEKLMTVDKEHFERHRKGNAHLLTDEDCSTTDAYHYSTVGDFIMRSQLDAHDSKLPGTGVFDLKTRAVLPIRMSNRDYEFGTHYEIRTRFGEYESYEREYFDMIRATMLKYSLQVRMGRMDGIFVAYHNIARIFGFQYISTAEMDQTLHGQRDPCLGDQEFLFSVKMMSDLFNRAIERFPQQTLRVHIESRPAAVPFMFVFFEPISDKLADSIQTRNDKQIKEWQRTIMRMNDIDGEDAENGADSKDQPQQTDVTKTTSAATKTPGGEKVVSDTNIKNENTAEADSLVLGFVVTTRSEVNRTEVDRVSKLKPEDTWKLHWTVSEIKVPARFYRSLQERRAKIFDPLVQNTDSDGLDEWFISNLKKLSKRGGVWRQTRDAADKGKPIRMWNDIDDKSHTPTTVQEPARENLTSRLLNMFSWLKPSPSKTALTTDVAVTTKIPKRIKTNLHMSKSTPPSEPSQSQKTMSKRSPLVEVANNVETRSITAKSRTRSSLSVPTSTNDMAPIKTATSAHPPNTGTTISIQPKDPKDTVNSTAKKVAPQLPAASTSKAVKARKEDSKRASRPLPPSFVKLPAVTPTPVPAIRDFMASILSKATDEIRSKASHHSSFQIKLVQKQQRVVDSDIALVKQHIRAETTDQLKSDGGAVAKHKMTNASRDNNVSKLKHLLARKLGLRNYRKELIVLAQARRAQRAEARVQNQKKKMKEEVEVPPSESTGARQMPATSSPSSPGSPPAP